MTEWNVVAARHRPSPEHCTWLCGVLPTLHHCCVPLLLLADSGHSQIRNRLSFTFPDSPGHQHQLSLIRETVTEQAGRNESSHLPIARIHNSLKSTPSRPPDRLQLSIIENLATPAGSFVPWTWPALSTPSLNPVLSLWVALSWLPVWPLRSSFCCLYQVGYQRIGNGARATLQGGVTIVPTSLDRWFITKRTKAWGQTPAPHQRCIKYACELLNPSLPPLLHLQNRLTRAPTSQN